MRTLGRVARWGAGVGTWLAVNLAAAQQAPPPQAPPLQAPPPANTPASGAPASAPATSPQPASAPNGPAQPGSPVNAAATAPAASAGGERQAALSDEPGHRAGEPRFEDANADRVVLFSTAETHPKGTFFFSDYEIVLLQFGYAFTDSLQISLTGVPPLLKNQPYLADVALKAVLLRRNLIRLGIVGGGTVISVPDEDPSRSLFPRVYGIAQLCFETVCKSSLSLSAGTFINNSASNLSFPTTFGGGLVVRLSSLVKLLLEPTYLIGDRGVQRTFMLNYGIRLSGNQFGFDLAFIRPLDKSGSYLGFGIPWLTFTYRTAGD